MIKINKPSYTIIKEGRRKTYPFENPKEWKLLFSIENEIINLYEHITRLEDKIKGLEKKIRILENRTPPSVVRMEPLEPIHDFNNIVSPLPNEDFIIDFNNAMRHVESFENIN